jgi:hypothetical protein
MEIKLGDTVQILHSLSPYMYFTATVCREIKPGEWLVQMLHDMAHNPVTELRQDIYPTKYLMKVSE